MHDRRATDASGSLIDTSRTAPSFVLGGPGGPATAGERVEVGISQSAPDADGIHLSGFALTCRAAHELLGASGTLSLASFCGCTREADVPCITLEVRRSDVTSTFDLSYPFTPYAAA